jgi:anti-anti-sigma factor
VCVDPSLEPLEFRLASAHVADSTYLLSLAGELDLANAPQVDVELESLTSDGARNVIVDLLEVPFIDSTTLGVLMRHACALQLTGGDLMLVTDDLRVTRVIELTGLTGHFRIERSLGEAIDRATAGVRCG